MNTHVYWAGWLTLSVVLTASGQTAEPLSLQEALRIALNNNSEIGVAQKGTEVASGRTLQAGRISNPDVSLSFNEVPASLAFGDAGERDIGLTQVIEFPGKRSSRVEVAEHGNSIAGLILARTKALVSARVKQSYYQCLLSKEVGFNLKFMITLLSDFLSTVTERYEAGASKYLDVIRAKVELTRLQNDLVEANRRNLSQVGELNVLLGRNGNTPVVLSDSLTFQPLVISLDSAMELGLNRSNSLKLAEQESLRGQALLNLAKTSYLPDFSIGLAWQRHPGQSSTTVSQNFLGFQVGASFPLWFWQGPRGEVLESQASLDISIMRVEAAHLRVQNNIMTAFRNASVAQEQLRIFDATLLRDAEDELRAGISAYQNNQIDALNVFDIYRTYQATKSEHARALHNLLAAKADLEIACEVVE